MYEPNTHQQQQYLHAPYPHSKSHYSHHHWTPTAAAMSSTGSEETMMTDHNNNNTMVGNQESLNIHAKEFVPDGNH